MKKKIDPGMDGIQVEPVGEEWGILPYPYATQEPVELKMYEYKIPGKPQKLKVKWIQTSELVVDSSLFSKEWEYSVKLDIIIHKMHLSEDNRVRQMNRFLEQMHNADTVQFLKRLLFETQTGLK